MKRFFILICLSLPVQADIWDDINQSLLAENWALADIQLYDVEKQTTSQRERFNVLLNQAWVKLKLGLTGEAQSKINKAKSLSYQPGELEKLTLDDTTLIIKYHHLSTSQEFDRLIIIDKSLNMDNASLYFNQSDTDNLDLYISQVTGYTINELYGQQTDKANSYFRNARSASVWTRRKIDEYMESGEESTPFIKPIPPKLLRGEFEKTDQFITRVEQAQNRYKKVVERFHQNEREKQQALVKQRRQKEQYLPTISRLYTQAAIKKTIGLPQFELQPYNAENEFFTAKIKPQNTSDFFQGLTVAIDEPIDTAREFKKLLLQAKPALIFSYSQKGVTLVKALIELPDQSLREARIIEQVEEQQLASYQVPEIEYQQDYVAAGIGSVGSLRTSSEVLLKSIDPEIKRLKTALNSAEIANDQQKIERLKNDIALFETRLQQSFDDDLEVLLKRIKTVPENPNLYAIVVGINQYAKTLNVEYADRSARLFAKIAQRVLGVPKSNIIELYNKEATGSTIKTRMKYRGRNLKAGDKLYFYYAGHGIPAQQEQGDPYLLAHDMSAGFASLDEDMRLSNIWGLLTKSGQGDIIAFLDSCFSGNADNRFIFEGVAPGLLKRKSFNRPAANNLLIYTAGNEVQFANYYPEKGHRLFSYFLARGLMKGIKQPEDLHQYLARNVERISQQNGPDYKQTPQMNGSVRGGF